MRGLDYLHIQNEDSVILFSEENNFGTIQYGFKINNTFLFYIDAIKLNKLYKKAMRPEEEL